MSKTILLMPEEV
jgi:nucleosome assembly protein 1-like 1